MIRRFGTGVLLFAVACLGCGEAEKANWTTTSSGLKYEDLEEGDGPAAKKGDLVKVHYTGVLAENKRQFDSSRGKEPLPFTIGAREVIPGWEEGIVGMKVGGKRRLYIPARLAYDRRGYPPDIPPDADLLFEVQLEAINK